MIMASDPGPGHVENSLMKPWKEVILQFIFGTKLSQQT